jgi:hypothetical protein
MIVGAERRERQLENAPLAVSPLALDFRGI